MKSPTDLPVLVLHAHTTMSMLDGASPVDEYVDYAKSNEHPVCSCTDHGWMSGVYDLITKSGEAKIRPVPGVEFYLMPHPDHKFQEKPWNYFHLTVWASSMKGYQSLIALASRSWDDGRPVALWGKPRPRITWEDLDLHKEGLIVGSGCIEGPIGKCLLNGQEEEAWRYARRLKEMFGDRLFFEVMPSRVDRDYVKGHTVKVSGVNGITYRFMPDDILETDQGEMTAFEALQKMPAEILFVKPPRIQDGPMSSGLEDNNLEPPEVEL